MADYLGYYSAGSALDDLFTVEDVVLSASVDKPSLPTKRRSIQEEVLISSTSPGATPTVAPRPVADDIDDLKAHIEHLESTLRTERSEMKTLIERAVAEGTRALSNELANLNEKLDTERWEFQEKMRLLNAELSELKDERHTLLQHCSYLEGELKARARSQSGGGRKSPEVSPKITSNSPPRAPPVEVTSPRVSDSSKEVRFSMEDMKGIAQLIIDAQLGVKSSARFVDPERTLAEDIPRPQTPKQAAGLSTRPVSPSPGARASSPIGIGALTRSEAHLPLTAPASSQSVALDGHKAVTHVQDLEHQLFLKCSERDRVESEFLKMENKRVRTCADRARKDSLSLLLEQLNRDVSVIRHNLRKHSMLDR